MFPIPMSINLVCCALLPPATTLSVPIYDFASAHEEGLAGEATEEYRYPCCGAFVKVVPTPYIVLERQYEVPVLQFQPSWQSIRRG